MDVSKATAMESAGFFKITEDSKVSCVKIIVWSIFVQEGTNILIFYIFDYGAEYEWQIDCLGASYIRNKVISKNLLLNTFL